MTRKQIKKELNKLAKQIDKIPDHVFLDGSAEEDPKIKRLLSRYDTLRRSINKQGGSKMNRNNEEKQYDIKGEMYGKMPIYYYPVADKRIKHIQKVWTNNVDKERNEIRRRGGIIVPSPYTGRK